MDGAPGAVHGPHQIFKAWSDKYKGKFDAGWDVYRQQTFARQKALGWVPKDAKLTPRPDTLPAWDSLSPEAKKFQARLMEVYEIGRASCRERVCQYVYISVVAVNLKKQINKNTEQQ